MVRKDLLMASDKKEDLGLEAVRAIAEALTPLDEQARTRVLTSALALLGMRMPQMGTQLPDTSSQGVDRSRSAQETTDQGASVESGGALKPTDIKTLREQKMPKSDIEMAALMAYYLEHHAPKADRRDYVTADDIKTYFKQAQYRLPRHAGQTLRNAKNAGYLEPLERGRFRLNPVGYNLIAHALPREQRARSRQRKTLRKATATKKRQGRTAKATSKRRGSK
jgi:hypothetical protein